MRLIWFRALMMTISLVFVIYAIRNLNRNGVNPQLSAMLGVPSAKSVSVNLPGRLNWCETRVASIRLLSGTEIRQEKLKWMKISADQQSEIHPVAMEKWLGKHCEVESELTGVASSEGGGRSEIPFKSAVVTFIKGEPKTLLRYPNGDFVWGGQKFRSKDLAAALQDLEQLPTVGSSSVDKK